ncbi:MAG: hypothetical protein M1813_003295 [Trichoglossum hirsutum]|nr:MAG: hypothetical protein M1813_003295 [Trichoglossum hirsutum]
MSRLSSFHHYGFDDASPAYVINNVVGGGSRVGIRRGVAARADGMREWLRGRSLPPLTSPPPLYHSHTLPPTPPSTSYSSHKPSHVPYAGQRPPRAYSSASYSGYRPSRSSSTPSLPLPASPLYQHQHISSYPSIPTSEWRKPGIHARDREGGRVYVTNYRVIDEREVPVEETVEFTSRSVGVRRHKCRYCRIGFETRGERGSHEHICSERPDDRTSYRLHPVDETVNADSCDA